MKIVFQSEAFNIFFYILLREYECERLLPIEEKKNTVILDSCLKFFNIHYKYYINYE